MIGGLVRVIWARVAFVRDLDEGGAELGDG